MEIRIGPPTVTVHNDDQFLVCEPNAEMSSTEEHGYFAADTRLVSGYRLKLGGQRPVLCNSSAVEHHSARFEFTNRGMVDSEGDPLASRCVHLRLDRTIGTGVHEDYDLTNYGRRTSILDLEISVEADFADLFDVKAHRPLRRGELKSAWDEPQGRLLTTYRHDGFSRGILIEVDKAGSAPQYTNGGIGFRISLEPGGHWHTCILWRPVLTDGSPGHPLEPCHDLVGDSGPHRLHRRWVSQASRFVTSSPSVTQTVAQAIDDLAGLRMHRHDGDAAGHDHDHIDRTQSLDAWVPAAGVPWFVTLFGRDSLIVSLQTLSMSPRFALGSLRALGALQADGRDDYRDMDPGKIHHEIRHGELACLGLIPHTPYYGTHDASALYVLLAAKAWQWHGDRNTLDWVRPHVQRALRWIDEHGDLDGDGLQEYRTRSSQGYYNQGWKDAEDAIVHADGTQARLPIAPCELQGLVVAAKRAWAGVLDDVYQDRAGASALRAGADRLAAAVESRFWWEDQGTYYLGLDGDKQAIESVASNPGQLLWTEAIDAGRAQQVAKRLLEPDMWSGWGIRTLSAEHRAYNPFSYQLGSVWPHDNALIAAGLRAYGLDAPAERIARALFNAADQFSSHRLPELFAGLARDEAGFPVQYLGANVPQAWASGAVVHLLATLLGLQADATKRTLRLHPALPEWLPEIRVQRLSVGAASVDLRITRRPDGTHELCVEDLRGRLEVLLDGDSHAGAAAAGPPRQSPAPPSRPRPERRR